MNTRPPSPGNTCTAGRRPGPRRASNEACPCDYQQRYDTFELASGGGGHGEIEASELTTRRRRSCSETCRGPAHAVAGRRNPSPSLRTACKACCCLHCGSALAANAYGRQLHGRDAEETEEQGRTFFAPTVHAGRASPCAHLACSNRGWEFGRRESSTGMAEARRGPRDIYVSGVREGVAVRAKAKVRYAGRGPVTELGCDFPGSQGCALCRWASRWRVERWWERNNNQ